ncbi:MAG: DNA gyrase subunit A [Candidatus Marinimicrobia bacterium]|nr:DNA gyrase subunit A [Candidatus Neomarinimicrobiota bacterium]MCF7829130.1 DNA gyrase subunit A [Candidatus Neomarinimicrobiota bacterium]MCF7881471.1 DNA gyrase subunit A [Candidatus Neomarinimicrobiota bacterium]
MRDSYLDYSMSVIVSRALPDVRDGMKPVHRRVLYGMQDLGLTYNKAYKKSARIVGEVMGKYHPHGDSAVYDTVVRMAQEFSLRYPLVDGQGNFGSVDGDSAAAMRYTEARMSRIAGEMLRDLEKETVDFVDNFDGTLEEPDVLPTVLPNLLVNGSSGIAVGMSTNIPPHNLDEVVDGIEALIDNPDLEVDALMEHIKGPDFPTGAIIYGADGIKEAYETGRGKITMRARARTEQVKGNRENIIVTELPYQVNKAKLIEKIAQHVRNEKITGISDIRDESDKEGVRIVIELKRDEIAQVVLNQLFKHTQMQETFGVISIALVGGIPKVLTLKEMLQHFIDFRHEVVVRRTEYELNKAQERAHILEGYKIALDNLDEVIKIIRGSDNPTDAREALMDRFEFSEAQAQAILDMRLQRLTSMEIKKVVEEYKEILKTISRLENILESRPQRMSIIKKELTELRERFGDERRTEIIRDAKEFSIEDMIADEEMVVTITHTGYIKRTPVSTFRRQRRGGRGLQGAGTKDDDFIEHLFIASTHDYMLFFTELGMVHWLKVHEIPQAGRASRGRAIVNILNLNEGDTVTAFLNVKEFTEDHYVTMATKNGQVKKTELAAYSNPQKGGIYAIDIREGDRLIEVSLTDGDQDIILGTANGKAIRFHESDVRPTGRRTQGVKGVTLKDNDDEVVGMVPVKREGTVLAVSESGFGKRTEVLNYNVQKRGGQGVITIKTTKKVGRMVALKEVVDNDDLMIITQKGVLIRQPVETIATIGRNTQGVKLIRLDEGDRIAAVTRVVENENGEENDDEE